MTDQQQSLNQLLQWSIENSSSTQSTTPSQQPRDPSKGLNPEALRELLGGPSDADRMRAAMTAILAPSQQVPLEDKMTAWDNFEQLIEQIDNANNMESLGLWAPLIQQLDSEEAECRRMAAWCLGTAVQNNVKCQELMLGKGVIKPLVEMAKADQEQSVRKKAVTALSSGVRNFQPGMDELQRHVGSELWGGEAGVDAGDMEAVDGVIGRLREYAARE